VTSSWFFLLHIYRRCTDTRISNVTIYVVLTDYSLVLLNNHRFYISSTKHITWLTRKQTYCICMWVLTPFSHYFQYVSIHIWCHVHSTVQNMDIQIKYVLQIHAIYCCIYIVFWVYLIRFTIIQRNIKYMNGSYKSLLFLSLIVRSQNSIFNKCMLIHKIQQLHPLKMIPRFRNRRGCDRDMFGLLKNIYIYIYIYCLGIMVCVRIRVAACGGIWFQDLVDSSRLLCVIRNL
jgi:hypothetical protein